jgi:flagellar FliL protein
MSEERNEPILEEEEPTKKPGIMVPLIFALVAAAGGATLGLTVLGPAVAPTLAARSMESGGKSKGGGHGGGHGEPAETLHVLENLVVNPAGSEGTRYLLISVAIEPIDQGMVEELAALDVSFRHTLLTTLGSKTVEELSDIATRPQIVAQLRDSLESVAGHGIIQNIYLPQYVIQ